MLMAVLSLLAVGFAEMTPLWPAGKLPDCQSHQIAARLEAANEPDFDAATNRLPYLQWYEAPTSNRTGQCMILISGGGYQNLCDGVWIDRFADYLTVRGVQCVALNYRTPRPKGLPIYQTAWEDGQRAVRLVRSAANRRGYAAEKIGVLGFSAGGHLSVLLATSSQTPAYARVDTLDDIPCHVNFAVPIFPAYVLSDGLEGPNSANGDASDVALNPCFKFDAKTCPMCLIHGSDDIYSSIGSVEIYRRLHAMGVSSDLHVYANKGHGFLSDNALLRSLDAWIDRVGDFVAAHGSAAGESGCRTIVAEKPERVLELPDGPGNPRNSEGSFVKLTDGRILYVYSHYDGDSGRDGAAAHLASRVSSDGGRTWSKKDVVVVERGSASNVMSTSLVRLQDGRLALFYLRKDGDSSCVPVMRISTDEARSWDEPTTCLPSGRPGYYVLNNDRACQLRTGRLVLPLCFHAAWSDRTNARDEKGELVCSVSDDGGRTWRFASEPFKTFAPDGRRILTQEPGVIELKDGRLMMWARTCEGVQYVTYSADGGETWGPARPWNLQSPCSPAQVTRLKNGDLLAVWNDHAGHPELRRGSSPSHAGFRTPLAMAVSSDEGLSWRCRKLLEGSPWGWYCYPAVCETEGALLLGYCAMRHLRWSRLTRVPLGWLYGPDPDPGDPTTRRSAFPTDRCDGELPPVVPAPRGFLEVDGWCPIATAKVSVAVDSALPPEAYRIVANPHSVRLLSSSPSGAFYAQRTLAHLKKTSGSGLIRCFRLSDAPQFPRRGIRLVDSGRMRTDDLRRLIEFMADCKLNALFCDLSGDGLLEIESFARDRHVTILRPADVPLADAADAPASLVFGSDGFGRAERMAVLEAAERLWTAPPVFDEKAFRSRAATWQEVADAR